MNKTQKIIMGLSVPALAVAVLASCGENDSISANLQIIEDGGIKSLYIKDVKTPSWLDVADIDFEVKSYQDSSLRGSKTFSMPYGNNDLIASGIASEKGEYKFELYAKYFDKNGEFVSSKEAISTTTVKTEKDLELKPGLLDAFIRHGQLYLVADKNTKNDVKLVVRDFDGSVRGSQDVSFSTRSTVLVKPVFENNRAAVEDEKLTIDVYYIDSKTGSYKMFKTVEYVAEEEEDTNKAATIDYLNVFAYYYKDYYSNNTTVKWDYDVDLSVNFYKVSTKVELKSNSGNVLYSSTNTFFYLPYTEQSEFDANPDTYFNDKKLEVTIVGYNKSTLEIISKTYTMPIAKTTTATRPETGAVQDTESLDATAKFYTTNSDNLIVNIKYMKYIGNYSYLRLEKLNVSTDQYERVDYKGFDCNYLGQEIVMSVRGSGTYRVSIANSNYAGSESIIYKTIIITK